jgi:hypothetical protein
MDLLGAVVICFHLVAISGYSVEHCMCSTASHVKCIFIAPSWWYPVCTRSVPLDWEHRVYPSNITTTSNFSQFTPCQFLVLNY